MPSPLQITFNEARTLLKREAYQRLTSALKQSCQRQNGSFPMVYIIDYLGIDEFMIAIRDKKLPDALPMRKLAAELAECAVPIYERFHFCHPDHPGGSVGAAVRAAAAFAEGRINKVDLNVGHKGVLEVLKHLESVFEPDILPDWHAAKAAEIASRPFGKPGRIVYETWGEVRAAFINLPIAYELPTALFDVAQKTASFITRAQELGDTTPDEIVGMDRALNFMQKAIYQRLSDGPELYRGKTPDFGAIVRRNLGG